METVWTGSVRDMVNYTAGTDARETVVDSKTGAKIRINISGDDIEETDEPFYIKYNDEYYDAYNRGEAVMILSNIRRGKEHPEMPPVSKPRKKSKSKPRKKISTPTSLRGMRR